MLYVFGDPRKQYPSVHKRWQQLYHQRAYNGNPPTRFNTVSTSIPKCLGGRHSNIFILYRVSYLLFSPWNFLFHFAIWLLSAYIRTDWRWLHLPSGDVGSFGSTVGMRDPWMHRCVARSIGNAHPPWLDAVYRFGIGLSWFLGGASCKICSSTLASFPSNPSHETTMRLSSCSCRLLLDLRFAAFGAALLGNSALRIWVSVFGKVSPENFTWSAASSSR